MLEARAGGKVYFNSTVGKRSVSFPLQAAVLKFMDRVITELQCFLSVDGRNEESRFHFTLFRLNGKEGVKPSCSLRN